MLFSMKMCILEKMDMVSKHKAARSNDGNRSTQHNYRNWAQHVAFVWPPCCDMLGVVDSNRVCVHLRGTLGIDKPSKSVHDTSF